MHYIITPHPAGRHDINSRLVLQQVLSCRGQHVQDLFLGALQRPLVGGRLVQEGVPLLLQLGPLLANHETEQLVLQTQLGYHEVDHSHLDVGGQLIS